MRPRSEMRNHKSIKRLESSVASAERLSNVTKKDRGLMKAFVKQNPEITTPLRRRVKSAAKLPQSFGRKKPSDGEVFLDYLKFKHQN